MPYIGLFLDSRGLNSHDIGLLLAIVTGMRIFGPSLWAALAAKRRDPIGVMRFGAVLATIGWLSSFYQGGYWPLVTGTSSVQSVLDCHFTAAGKFCLSLSGQ